MMTVYFDASMSIAMFWFALTERVIFLELCSGKEFEEDIVRFLGFEKLIGEEDEQLRANIAIWGF